MLLTAHTSCLCACCCCALTRTRLTPVSVCAASSAADSGACVRVAGGSMRVACDAMLLAGSGGFFTSCSDHECRVCGAPTRFSSAVLCTGIAADSASVFSPLARGVNIGCPGMPLPPPTPEPGQVAVSFYSSPRCTLLPGGNGSTTVLTAADGSCSPVPGDMAAGLTYSVNCSDSTYRTCSLSTSSSTRCGACLPPAPFTNGRCIDGATGSCSSSITITCYTASHP